MSPGPEDSGRRAYLDYRARCQQVFTPFAPIELPDFFAGRIEHVRRLEAEVDAPGRHVAIFGERGVGKTSLAKLAYFFLGRAEEHTHFARCQKTSTFDSIFADVLASSGIEVVLNGVESEGTGEGRLGIGPVSLGRARRLRKTFRRLSTGRRIQPQHLLDQFCGPRGLIIVDEYDRVVDPETHTRMAELIKHFSDAHANTKIILCGVAETVAELIGEHESLSRSLAQIKLDRMSVEELRSIVERGGEYLSTSFKQSTKSRIIRLADGFPYFVHLLCLHACRIAGRVLEESPDADMIVADEEYRDGLYEALKSAEHSLEEQYEGAVVTTQRRSEKFELILWAMALSDECDVQVRDIAQNAMLLVGREIKPASFSWNLGELSSDRRGSVLTKVRKGYYKFTNPLLRPYIRFLLELENIIKRGEQWEFPFMK